MRSRAGAKVLAMAGDEPAVGKTPVWKNPS
jgi:hypothetical protein